MEPLLTGLLVSLLAVAPAVADDSRDSLPEAPPVPAAPDPTNLLKAAVDLYLDGRPVEARAALEDLLAIGPALPATVREDALAYLGDILYSEQNASAARGVFEALLAEAPRYTMDPFNHPPEVVRHFEALRRELVPDLPPPLSKRVRRDPYPWTIALPLGAHYFKEREVLPGLTVAIVQLAGAGASLWSRSEMLAIPNHRVDAGSGIPIDEDPDGSYRSRYETLRAVNLTSGLVGWAAYVVPVTVETIRWGARTEATVTLSPTEVRFTVSF